MSQTSIEIDSSDGMISDPSTGDSSSSSEEERSSDEEDDDDSDWWRDKGTEKMKRRGLTREVLLGGRPRRRPRRLPRESCHENKMKGRRCGVDLRRSRVRSSSARVIGHQWTALSRREVVKSYHEALGDMRAVDWRCSGLQRPWSQNQDCIEKAFSEWFNAVFQERLFEPEIINKSKTRLE